MSLFLWISVSVSVRVCVNLCVCLRFLSSNWSSSVHGLSVAAAAAAVVDVCLSPVLGFVGLTGKAGHDVEQLRPVCVMESRRRIIPSKPLSRCHLSWRRRRSCCHSEDSSKRRPGRRQNSRRRHGKQMGNRCTNTSSAKGTFVEARCKVK